MQQTVDTTKRKEDLKSTSIRALLFDYDGRISVQIECKLIKCCERP